MGSAALTHPCLAAPIAQETGWKISVAGKIETRRWRAIPGEAKMIDSPFHQTQNGVFSIQEEQIDRQSGECRFKIVLWIGKHETKRNQDKS